ncbi:MAG: ribose 5-phosphate isomerase B [Desulfovibrionaceae bacterium]
MFKKVFVGSDHGGFALKEAILRQLEGAPLEAVDLGTHSATSCDYPLIAKAVCEAVLAEPGSCGILVCGTGIGMSMAANRIPGIRAGLCTDGYMARMTRAHNDANVLCLGERVIGQGLAADLVDTFLNTEFEGERHMRRINLFDK